MDTVLPFIVFAIVANTAAELGYNYQHPRPLTNQIFRPSAPFISSSATPLVPPPVPQYIPPTNGVAGSPAHFDHSQFVAPSSQYIPPVHNQQQRQTVVSNNVYIHSAPEETEEIFVGEGLEAGPIRKNYRILFVRAPTHNIRLNLNSLKQAQAEHEEKTVIYVLSKKPDIASFQSQLSAIQNEPKTHKPEVFFIKYKTQAEANRAQQDIQAQYNALGGSTSISDEGFAPVTSVIGSAGQGASSASLSDPSSSGGSNFVQSASSNQQNFIQAPLQGSHGSASSVSFGIAAPSSRYLPAKKK